MVVDTSPVVAIAIAEDGFEALAAKIELSTNPVMSSVSYMEARLVLLKKRGTGGRAILDDVISVQGIRIVSFTPKQAQIAAAAYERYGKGRHPARLNFGDCMVYALAKQLGEPLLFVGNDFGQTDLIPA